MSEYESNECSSMYINRGLHVKHARMTCLLPDYISKSKKPSWVLRQSS